MIHFFPSRAIALSVGALEIHWYGIMYLLGFLIGMWLLPRLLRFRKLDLPPALRESLLLSVFLGVVLGGRLGFVLFYGGSYYIHRPLEILAVWHGGMSSHGGFIGVAIALILFTRRHRIDLFSLLDVLVIPIALGLALGRLGNFINGELYGTVTTLPWAMSFPQAEGLRHPVQLYAVLKDLLIAFVCFLHLRSTASHSVSSLPQGERGRGGGGTSALFLVMYAVLRFTLEIFREQPYGTVSVFGVLLSRGQLLTIPLFVAGIGICFLRSHASCSSMLPEQ